MNVEEMEKAASAIHSAGDACRALQAVSEKLAANPVCDQRQKERLDFHIRELGRTVIDITVKFVDQVNGILRDGPTDGPRDCPKQEKALKP